LQETGAVLLFNFSGSRYEEIRSLCDDCGLRTVVVGRHQYEEQIGSLFGLDGFPQIGASGGKATFSDEMMVIYAQRDTLERLLGLFSSRNVKRVNLKAMLTQTNAAWTANVLHEHLVSEHAAMLADRTRLR
jgi:hypothetical protein